MSFGIGSLCATARLCATEVMSTVGMFGEGLAEVADRF
jgi:hypothetical protein